MRLAARLTMLGNLALDAVLRLQPCAAQAEVEPAVLRAGTGRHGKLGSAGSGKRIRVEDAWLQEGGVELALGVCVACGVARLEGFRGFQRMPLGAARQNPWHSPSWPLVQPLRRGPER